MLNDQVLARALYRGSLFVVALVALVFLGIQLKWVLVQLFAAAIVAAGTAPIVARLTDPERTRVALAAARGADRGSRVRR